MAYLGRAVDSGAISNIENLDNITFDGSSSYSLTKNSVAFVPASASNLLISIDGVVNATNFTVSGSTVDFGVAVSSSSVCNFIIHLGVGIVTAPSDSSVTTAKLASGAVNNSKIASDAGIATTKLGTGAVLQVVSGTASTEFLVSSPTNHQLYFPSSNKLTVSITPSSTSSKILVHYLSGLRARRLTASTGDTGAAMALRETIGGTSTDIRPYAGGNKTYAEGIYIASIGAGQNIRARLSEQMLRSPSTTSEITYEVGVSAYQCQDVRLMDDGSTGRIQAIEIAG